MAHKHYFLMISDEELQPKSKINVFAIAGIDINKSTICCYPRLVRPIEVVLNIKWLTIFRKLL